MPESNGNFFSILAIFVWIFVAVWGARRWPASKTAAVLLLVPLLFLPEQVYFRLPALPLFPKERIAVFWLLVGALLFHSERLRSVRLGRWFTASAVLLLGSHVITVLANSDVIAHGAVYVPAHVPYDAVHVVVGDVFDYLLPMFLGAAMFRDARDLRVLMRTVAAAGLVYSLFQLIEIRLSPQLHNWVYGFFQHSFAQTKRGDGFRPTVFMEHGLAVAMFTLAALIALAAIYKLGGRVFRIPAGWALAYLWLVLLLGKSSAAFLYSLLAVPLVLFFSPRTQMRVALAFGVILILYPTLRGSGLVPVDDIKERVTAVLGEDRAESLVFRFENEEVLLERANERPLFGWGWFGRAEPRNPKTGETTTTPDGDWVITVGKWGRAGYFGKYLLLMVPLILASRRIKRVRRASDRRLLGALGLMIGFSTLDLLPNGNWNYLIFVFSGALVGCSSGILVEQQKVRRTRARPQPVPAFPEPPGYPQLPSVTRPARTWRS